LVSQLESGDEIDLPALARGMGSTLEYMLCSLFSEHEATRAYWVDGVVLSTPALLPDRSIVARGYAWCAADRVQWQVPAQVSFSLSDRPDRRFEFLRIQIGDAKKATLDAHRTRRPSDFPREWLFEFDVSPESYPDSAT
jgi:hypothetical protein